MELWEVAANYHQQTKHHFHRHARSLGYMDWATQPNPFRRFAPAPLLILPLAADEQTPSYDAIYEPNEAPVQAVTVQTLGSFFQLSRAISAWKEYEGSRWALRVNPSSGNLHPTEGYLVAPAIRGLHHEPGVYHYAPHEHGLELRTTFSQEIWDEVVAGFPPGTFFVGLSSIHWREAWKYGERAYRYCQHDIGHALAAIRVAAAVHGWSATWLATLSDEALAALLGLDRLQDFEPEEREEPEVLAAIIPSAAANSENASIPHEITRKIAAGSWNGKAQKLSENHVNWDAIADVAKACLKPEAGISHPRGACIGDLGKYSTSHIGIRIPDSIVVAFLDLYINGTTSRNHTMVKHDQGIPVDRQIHSRSIDSPDAMGIRRNGAKGSVGFTCGVHNLFLSCSRRGGIKCPTP